MLMPPNEELWDHKARKNPSLCLGVAMLHRKVEGAKQSPLWCGMGTPEVHGPFSESQWGWYYESLTLGTHGWWTWNLLHPKAGSHPPGGGTWATRGPRGCCIPPGMSRNSQAQATHWADWCSKYPCSFIPYIKTLQLPFPENKEILVRKPAYHRPRCNQQRDLALHREKWKDTRLVVGIPVHLPTGGWAHQWCPSKDPATGKTAIFMPDWKRVAGGALHPAGCVEMKGLPPSDWIPGHLGPPNGDAGRNSSAGPGSSMVHHTIQNAPRGAVQSGSGALQLPCFPAWEGQSVESYNDGCDRERSCDSIQSYRKGLITEGEIRTWGRRANWPTYPNGQQALEP